MALIKESLQTQLCDLKEHSKIKIICPVCKFKKELKFPKSVINQARLLTTISIPKGLVCNHHFQVFVDKNFQVRGYQKVDFEFASNLLKKKRSNKKTLKIKDKEFLEYLVIEENYLAYKPRENQIIIEKKDSNMKSFNEIDFNQISSNQDNPNKTLTNSNPQKEEMSLEEIYNEFWEFIDDDNDVFKEYIIEDKRRVHLE